MLLQAAEMMRIGVMFPLYSLAYIAAPHSAAGRTLRKPFIKFLCHSASYFMFLCKYLNYHFYSRYKNYINSQVIFSFFSFINLGVTENWDFCGGSALEGYSRSAAFEARIATFISWMAHFGLGQRWVLISLFFVLHGTHPGYTNIKSTAGLIWSEVKQLWDMGLREYVHDMWNVIDFVTNSLYVATVALRVVSHFQVPDTIFGKFKCFVYASFTL